jgi:hypothetical protein
VRLVRHDLQRRAELVVVEVNLFQVGEQPGEKRAWLDAVVGEEAPVDGQLVRLAHRVKLP